MFHSYRTPLTKESAIYYIKLGEKIVLKDSRKNAFICCEYAPSRTLNFPSYKLDLLTITDIKDIINRCDRIQTPTSKYCIARSSTIKYVF